MGYNILRKYCNEYTQKMIHHLSWGDEETSLKIIEDITLTLKEYNIYITTHRTLRDINGVTNLINNTSGLFEIEDAFKMHRIKAFFCLDDISENENESIFNFLVSFRDDSPFHTLVCLKLLADLMKKFPQAFNYVSNYSSVRICYLFF